MLLLKRASTKEPPKQRKSAYYISLAYVTHYCLDKWFLVYFSLLWLRCQEPIVVAYKSQYTCSDSTTFSQIKKIYRGPGHLVQLVRELSPYAKSVGLITGKGVVGGRWNCEKNISRILAQEIVMWQGGLLVMAVRVLGLLMPLFPPFLMEKVQPCLHQGQIETSAPNFCFTVLGGPCDLWAQVATRPPWSCAPGESVVPNNREKREGFLVHLRLYILRPGRNQKLIKNN